MTSLSTHFSKTAILYSSVDSIDEAQIVVLLEEHNCPKISRIRETILSERDSSSEQLFAEAGSKLLTQRSSFSWDHPDALKWVKEASEACKELLVAKAFIFHQTKSSCETILRLCADHLTPQHHRHYLKVLKEDRTQELSQVDLKYIASAAEVELARIKSRKTLDTFADRQDFLLGNLSRSAKDLQSNKIRKAWFVQGRLHGNPQATEIEDIRDQAKRQRELLEATNIPFLVIDLKLLV